MRMRSTAAGLSALLVTSVALTGCGATKDQASSGYAKDKDTIVFAVVPDTAAAQGSYQPLIDYIGKKTGKKVEFMQSTDYSALIQAAVNGKVDVASFSGFTYVTAKNKGAKIAPISAAITKEGAKEPGYESMAIVPQGSPIKTIADMKGKKICFVDPGSTSGYLFPSYALKKAGIDPEKDITPVLAGKHDASAQKVAAGKECEAGFAEDIVATKQEGVTVIDKQKVPGAPVVMSETLPDDVKKTLTDALGSIDRDGIKAAGVEGTDSEGFKNYFQTLVPVDDAYYDTIRDICKETNAKQCQA